MSKIVRFNVEMTCQGCENAVINVVKKVNGVVDVHASHVDKTVTVTGTASDSDIIAANS